MSKMLVSIVIPVYNEEKILESSVKNLKETLSEFSDDFDFELILAENGSKDESNPRVKSGTRFYLRKDLLAQQFQTTIGSQHCTQCEDADQVEKHVQVKTFVDFRILHAGEVSYDNCKPKAKDTKVCFLPEAECNRSKEDDE